MIPTSRPLITCLKTGLPVILGSSTDLVRGESNEIKYSFSEQATGKGPSFGQRVGSKHQTRSLDIDETFTAQRGGLMTMFNVTVTNVTNHAHKMTWMSAVTSFHSHTSIV